MTVFGYRGQAADDPGGPAAPPGHSHSAHTLHGWCASCAGRTADDEVAAWRALAQTEAYAAAPRRQGRTVSLDFDGVLHDYRDGWRDGTVYGEPVPGSYEAVHHLLTGFAVVVTTARAELGDVAAAVRRWYRVSAIVLPPGKTLPFWDVRGVVLVTNVKMPACAYIDDRGIRFDGEWLETMEAFRRLYGHLATDGPPPMRPVTGTGGRPL